MSDSPVESAAEPAAGLAIEVRELAIDAGGRRLYESATLEVARGELVLVVGGSGTGKSVLLRVLADLPRPATIRVEGTVRTHGRVGMVFQQGALLEDLDPEGNVRFALDHAGSRAEGEGTPSERARRLLKEVRIPPDLPLPTASGGQRRRVAIARALAAGPEILLYDEPTAGLDPDLAAHVGRILRKTHEASGQTTLVVTHDFGALGPVADRIVFLDPATRTLGDVTLEALDGLVADGAFRSEPDEPEAPARPSITDEIAAALTAWGASTIDFTSSIGASLLPRWRQPVWGLRALAHHLRLVAGPTAVAYVGLAGVVVGFVATFFAFEYLPYAGYLRPLVTDDLLGAIGFALYRILIPILATTLIAARCGAAVASDLAGRSYREELDALRTLGASPGGYQGFAGWASLVLATPVLVLASFVVARAVALGTFAVGNPDVTPAFVRVSFHATLREEGFWWVGTGWLLGKCLASGAVVGLTAVGFGFGPKRTPADVSAAVTRTILLATTLVLVVHFVFALFEFRGLTP